MSQGMIHIGIRDVGLGLKYEIQDRNQSKEESLSRDRASASLLCTPEMWLACM